MVTYNHEDEMLYDVPHDSIMVFDVDTQGLMNLSTTLQSFVVEFPISYATYLNKCRDGSITAGTMIALEERGKKIALLVTHDQRVGQFKDMPNNYITYSKLAIDELANTYPDVPIASTILMRHTSIWTASLVPYINSLGLNWTVYKT